MIATSLRHPGTVLIALVLLQGCVSFKPASRAPSAEANVLEGVPLVEFGAQNCGAASLSAVLTYWGSPSSIEDLDAALPKAHNGGVLSLDMALAARDRGFDAELVTGSRELLEQRLSAGQPLILMLQIVDIVGQSRDLFHYVIVDGIDPAKNLVRVQFGDGKARWVGLDRLSESWDNTGFATLAIRPGGEQRRSADPILYAVALEEAGLLAEAEAIYRHELAIDPQSTLLLMNLGNVLRGQGRGQEAELAYREVLELQPMDIDALNNLAWLLLECGGDLSEAQELVSRAVALGGPDPYLALDTMGRILLTLDRCEDATEVFATALKSVPEATLARGWILYSMAMAQADCGREQRAIESLEMALLESSDADLSAAVETKLRSLASE